MFTSAPPWSQIFSFSQSRAGARAHWLTPPCVFQVSKFDLYSMSLNWIATHTVSAIGNATIYPKNYVEIVFCILQLTVGCILQLTVGMTFYKMFMGKISTLIMAGDAQVYQNSSTSLIKEPCNTP